jgi:signal transduction histidine kinase
MAQDLQLGQRWSVCLTTKIPTLPAELNISGLRKLRSLSVRNLFLILLGSTFLLVVLASGVFAYRFGQFSAEAAKLAQNLQNTTTLSLEIRQELNEQINLVYRQFETVEPSFPSEFATINFELGEKQTRYLKLNIGTQERLTVERIKSLQAELGIQALQINYDLKNGKRTQALGRLRIMKEVENRINNEFSNLNSLETVKLSTVQSQLAETVNTTKLAIYGLGVYLLTSLLFFTFLLRRRVLQPLSLILSATNRIRRGDFTARAVESRPDELGEVARGFNFMAESLSESYSDLEAKVEERTQQLQQLQQQLIQSAKMSAVGRMLSGVAHELNNPLTVIIGRTDLARRKLIMRGADREDVQLMDDLNEQGERCRKIVANLLQFARQEKPQLEIVRLNDLVERALQLREQDLKLRNIEIEREFDPNNPVFCADSNKILQVVLNLVNNAHDAISEAKDAGVIRVRTSTVDEIVRLEFLDNGTGLREPERVFDPFYTTKEVGQGTGLGLSVCYGIIEEHGGTIKANNWEHGARFVIEIPRGDVESLRQETTVETAAEPALPTTHKALVVDDEIPLVEMQLAFLEDIGIEASGVHSGADAIKFLETNKVDLILSDVRMPGKVNGIQFYEWILENRPELKDRFIFVSGDMIGLNIGEFFVSSSVARIQKPFHWDDYGRLVQSLLTEPVAAL